MEALLVCAIGLGCVFLTCLSVGMIVLTALVVVHLKNAIRNVTRRW